MLFNFYSVYSILINFSESFANYRHFEYFFHYSRIHNFEEYFQWDKRQTKVETVDQIYKISHHNCINQMIDVYVLMSFTFRFVRFQFQRFVMDYPCGQKAFNHKIG